VKFQVALSFGVSHSFNCYPHVDIPRLAARQRLSRKLLDLVYSIQVK
jgi:hypothetical protein